ncbi:MAG: Transposase [Myxococcaceae bacterium]|nr:Transposase [Myxococcaceae bacterium]
MAAKKKISRRGRRAPARKQAFQSVTNEPRGRLQRSDTEKLQIVQQVLNSGNQSAEIKKLGIYPNQFYDWKKKYLSGGVLPPRTAGKRDLVSTSASSAAAEAKLFIEGKAALLERLRAQRTELDALIKQMEV